MACDAERKTKGDKQMMTGTDLEIEEASRAELRDRLASMTKRAEDAEAKLAIEHEANRHDPVRLKLVAAEAKLAAATAGIRNGLANLIALDDDPHPQTCIAAAKFCLADTLRALAAPKPKIPL
mgnify:FL=1